jgi:hypothetical protein
LIPSSPYTEDTTLPPNRSLVDELRSFAALPLAQRAARLVRVQAALEDPAGRQLLESLSPEAQALVAEILLTLSDDAAAEATRRAATIGSATDEERLDLLDAGEVVLRTRRHADVNTRLRHAYGLVRTALVRRIRTGRSACVRAPSRSLGARRASRRRTRTRRTRTTAPPPSPSPPDPPGPCSASTRRPS